VETLFLWSSFFTAAPVANYSTAAHIFHRFLKDDSGGSSIQYAFIAVVIPVAFIVFVNCLGPKSNTTVSTLGSATGMFTRLLNE